MGRKVVLVGKSALTVLAVVVLCVGIPIFVVGSFGKSCPATHVDNNGLRWECGKSEGDVKQCYCRAYDGAGAVVATRMSGRVSDSANAKTYVGGSIALVGLVLFMVSLAVWFGPSNDDDTNF